MVSWGYNIYASIQAIEIIHLRSESLGERRTSTGDEATKTGTAGHARAARRGGAGGARSG